MIRVWETINALNSLYLPGLKVQDGNSHRDKYLTYTHACAHTHVVSTYVSMLTHKHQHTPEWSAHWLVRNHCLKSKQVPSLGVAAWISPHAPRSLVIPLKPWHAAAMLSAGVVGCVFLFLSLSENE